MNTNFGRNHKMTISAHGKATPRPSRQENCKVQPTHKKRTTTKSTKNTKERKNIKSKMFIFVPLVSFVVQIRFARTLQFPWAKPWAELQSYGEFLEWPLKSR